MTKAVSLEDARAAKTKAVQIFQKLVGEEVAAGVTRIDDGFGLKINLTNAPGSIHLPAEVDGVPVEVEVVGTITKR